MGVSLTVEGMLLACELRQGDDGGSGFFSAAVLPADSRETLELWAFGDAAAAHELLKRFADDGVGAQVRVGVELRAKLRPGGQAGLTTRLAWALDQHGQKVQGRTPAALAALAGVDLADVG